MDVEQTSKLKVLCTDTLEGHENQVWRAIWRPDGEAILSCSGDKSIRLWAPINKSILAEKIHLSNAPISQTVDINPDSENNKTFTNYSEKWQCISSIEQAHKRAVRSICFQPITYESFASAGFDGCTNIWAKNYNKEYECFTTLEGHENEVKSVAWSPSGHLVATCGRDKSIWIWEVVGENDFECVSVLMEHTQDVKMLIWHPTEDILVSASYDDTVRIWKESEDDWYCSAILAGHKSTVWSIDFDPTGKFLVSCSDDLTAKIWTPKTTQKRSKALEFQSEPEWVCVCTIPSSFYKRSLYSVSWSKHFLKPLLIEKSEEKISLNHGYIATASGDNKMCVFAITSTHKKNKSDANSNKFNETNSIQKQSDSGRNEEDVSMENQDSEVNNVENYGILVDIDIDTEGSEKILMEDYTLQNVHFDLVHTISNAHGCFDVNSVAFNPNTKYANWLVSAGDDNNINIWYLQQ
ncbi:hypothetical protein BB559_005718 [Furculomyces boomerangus]|uniref:Probable cytosolic iron-sulfur protein assembly protein 1 n=1 Tax=Furculomyces boomerangus TaxID=61424 RepID=A0A2T9Y723_9FUNG|nr:hypothetical protein BB559_005718 [Furculomyces boomerangus]